MKSNAYQSGDSNQLKIAIKQDQITVAPESQAMLQVGIFNDSPNEDYVKVMVKGVPADWVILNTSVVHLAAGEAKLVSLTVAPPAVSDQRVGQYPLDVHVISQSDPKRSAVGRSVLTVAAYQSRGRLEVMLSSVNFSVTPGTSIDIPILLQNRGDEEDSFRLSVIGLPARWISTSSTLTKLKPDTSAEVLLTLQVPRSSQAAAGETRFTVQFASQLFSSQTTEVECNLTMAAFSEFSASLEPSEVQAGKLAQVIIYNQGNTVETYSLNFQGRGSCLLYPSHFCSATIAPAVGDCT